ncbi:MAG: biopolymer transporter ExbD [Candidatus Krumholzibacteriia bacterium]
MRKKGAFRSMAEINITSLVDVTLCLLIIFMLTAPYIQGGVEVDLPEADTRSVLVKEGPVISVTRDREVYFDQETIKLEDLPLRLEPYLPEKETIPVYLRADQEVPYGFVLRVMAAVERAGFVNLSLVSDRET